MGLINAYDKEQILLMKLEFDKGAQSRQAEINELNKVIDEALNFYNTAKSDVNIGMMQMAIYLKGNKND